MIHNVPDHRVNIPNPIPTFCLVDGDPYGLGIYGVYKYGGEKSSPIERERLAMPGLKYLGITSLDFDGADGIIALTERDQRRVEVMMQKEWVQQEPDVL
jgi:DNA topoisomerase VI subunit A